MCDTDFDPAEVWNETFPRARKSYKCGECHRAIPVGRQYVHITYLYDGKWSVHREHRECQALATFIEHEVCNDGGSILTGGLAEEIENLGEYDGGRTEQDHPALVAMGFELAGSADDDDRWEPATAQTVVEWLWNLIKAEYGGAVTAR
jgi:hypothetical protein